jgi:hypothetical protein
MIVKRAFLAQLAGVSTLLTKPINTWKAFHRSILSPTNFKLIQFNSQFLYANIRDFFEGDDNFSLSSSQKQSLGFPILVLNVSVFVYFFRIHENFERAVIKTL